MEIQEHINYQRIEQAIEYIRTQVSRQPDLEEIARAVHLSPYHFQRMFSEWVGISPKKYMQFLNVEHAKRLLRGTGANLAETSFQTGLSGTSRLHDLFIKIEAMTPAQYKGGGALLEIRYRMAGTPFGKVLVASTSKGICHMAFVDNEAAALCELRANFPHAHFQLEADDFQERALAPFSNVVSPVPIHLHLKGTPFQLKVWQALLTIPPQHLTTYGQIARRIAMDRAARAVGGAIGKNPIAYLIPCHRVILSNGTVGDYRWGSTRKLAIIAWEAAKGC